MKNKQNTDEQIYGLLQKNSKIWLRKRNATRACVCHDWNTCSYHILCAVKSSKIRLQGCVLFPSILDNNGKDLDSCKTAATSGTQLSHMVKGPARRCWLLQRDMNDNHGYNQLHACSRLNTEASSDWGK